VGTSGMHSRGQLLHKALSVGFVNGRAAKRRYQLKLYNRNVKQFKDVVIDDHIPTWKDSGTVRAGRCRCCLSCRPGQGGCC
jgi:hypothetical protein